MIYIAPICTELGFIAGLDDLKFKSKSTKLSKYLTSWQQCYLLWHESPHVPCTHAT